MNLEHQVCSLKLAKRLKELRVKQESLFKWAEYPHIMQFKEETGKHECIETRFEIMGTSYWREDHIDTWSAFTVAELGEMLPDSAYTQRILKDNWECIYLENYDYFSADTEANARAKMLIYLLENNIISNPL